MKKLSSKMFLFFIFLFGTANALACSIEVDNNYTKNQLIAHGVSFNDLSLSSVSGLSIASFQRSFTADPGNGGCPEYMNVSGRVSMNYSPAAGQHCTYSVSVTVRSFMGEELPDGPIEEVIFERPEAACSTSISAIKIPRKLPVRARRPFIVRYNP
jgi:hypothetical protein